MLHPQWSCISRPRVYSIYSLTGLSPDGFVAGGGAGACSAGHPAQGDGPRAWRARFTEAAGSTRRKVMGEAKHLAFLLWS